MSSNAKPTLHDAIAAMESAYARLAAATDIAIEERTQAAGRREAAQQEISLSWQSHASELETALTQATAENEFLKTDNLRLSNMLQKLQADYIELQSTAGDVVTRLDSTINQLDFLLEH